MTTYIEPVGTAAELRSVASADHVAVSKVCRATTVGEAKTAVTLVRKFGTSKGIAGVEAGSGAGLDRHGTIRRRADYKGTAAIDVVTIRVS